MPELEELLRGAVVTILATSDDSGTPHAVRKAHITYEDGKLLVPERLESGKTNSNLVHSLWFGRKAALLLLLGDGTSFAVQATPLRVHITGPLFERFYRQAPVAAVWELAPEGVREETAAVRAKEEAAAHPLLLHLDSIAKGATA
ncbi:MAG: hypothetical protein LBS96_01220 [Oscillospiraceae bacterium]|jgi:hypothetical protein|nr:hypothetical protein [Oscillospiraceae bacterium]